MLTAADAGFLVKMLAVVESEILSCFQFDRRKDVLELGASFMGSLT